MAEQFNHRRPHINRKGKLRVPNRMVRTFRVGEKLVLTKDTESCRTGSVMVVANIDQFPFVVMRPHIMVWKGGSIDGSESKYEYVFNMLEDRFVRASKAYVDYLRDHCVNWDKR